MKRPPACLACTEPIVEEIQPYSSRSFLAVIQGRHFGQVENLARYIIRACFSQERMTYMPEESKVVYRSKNGKEEKIFDALEWLAAMCSHVPNKGEQMVRYYGYYSNVSRGKRKIQDQDDLIPSILEPDGSSSQYRKNWARLPALARLMGYEAQTWTYLNYTGPILIRWKSRSGPGIQKIYEVDPLTCPRCQGRMRIIAFIEDNEVTRLPCHLPKAAASHLGL